MTSPILQIPTTISEIDKLISDGVQESLHLDYKRSAAIDDGKFDEIARDVSSFANSDGGILIYGVEEEKHLPTCKDAGVDHIKYNRERLENIILSRISPRVNDLQITQIPLNETKSIYAIAVGNSFRALIKLQIRSTISASTSSVNRWRIMNLKTLGQDDNLFAHC